MRAFLLLFLLLSEAAAFGQNRAPVARDTTFLILKNDSYVGSLRGLVSDPDPGQTLTFSPVPGSIQNGVLDLDFNGRFTFTPTPDFQGRASFSFTVCDNGIPIGCAVAGGTVNLVAAGSLTENFEPDGRVPSVAGEALDQYLIARCWVLSDMRINRNNNPPPANSATFGEGWLVSGPLSRLNQDVSVTTPILEAESPLRVRFNYRIINSNTTIPRTLVVEAIAPDETVVVLSTQTLLAVTPATNPANNVVGTFDQTFTNLTGDYKIRIRLRNNSSGGTARFIVDNLALTNAQLKYVNGCPPSPVTLAYFRAQALPTGGEGPRQTRLTWATANERDNERFELEHSVDLRTFTTIGTVAGNGTVATGRAYEYRHDGALPGTNYYRLRQIDTDGTQHTLRVVAVTFEGVLAQAYPNPTREQLTLRLSSAADREAALTVRYPDGRVAWRETVRLDASGSTLLNLYDRLPGLYLLTLEVTGQVPARFRVVRAQ
jgi:hypothetical protein